MENVIKNCEIPLFEGITECDIEALLKCLHAFTRCYKKDEIIIMDRDEIPHIGIVKSGKVHMVKQDVWGNNTLITYMKAGEMIGEIFAFQKNNNSFVSFIAAEDTEILYLTAHNIIHNCPNHCNFHAQLIENMFHMLGRKGLSLVERIDVSSKSSLREKLLSYISMQVQKQGSETITIPISKTELAKYLTANRSAMERELTNMKNDGIIDYEKKVITLKI